MDYGFVRGKVATKTEKSTLVTSKGGYNYYLFKADKFSRHLWVFLFAKKVSN